MLASAAQAAFFSSGTGSPEAPSLRPGSRNDGDRQADGLSLTAKKQRRLTVAI
ncbi:hypothetical protein [Erwinia sp. 198]|uniref:hypothetical protein n=1 Tax=Erwinia sp. 198 TaxID=2022746 RepID=UPI0013159B8B|nr:hypothetical protein [Erwinia sp. 198]